MLNPDEILTSLQLVIAASPSQGTEIQTLIFDKKKFTQKEAEEWLKKHNFKYGKVDEKDESFRFRQKDPESFDQSSFRTITITDGINAVIGKPRKE